MRILCAGDAFMKPEFFVAALREELGEGHEYITNSSGWPDVPYCESDEIQEWVGDEKQLIHLMPGVQILVTHVAPVTAALLQAAPDLRMISCSRGGPVNINLQAATECGISVAFVPGRNAQAVAEYTIGLIIAGQRHIVESDAALRQNATWSGHLYAYDQAGTELIGHTLGLFGMGQIGVRVARLLRNFSMCIITYDPYIDSVEAREVGVEKMHDFKRFLAEADILSLHMRLTPETRGIVNRETLSMMKRGAYLVNTARGKLIKTDDLVEALATGQLSGAALDVFEHEPLTADNPLLRFPQVIVTSHLAGSSREVAHRTARWTAEEVGRFVRGESLRACANPAVIKPC
ncbi:2-hydroxyacid dehydrogenase [Dictyobacter arantiisoli]|uniref:Oxidoreductase n=1 Tax=Dictyobacter arantiisoli TaxID=2014874 RepID=A0A5A5TE13_9CHLR|nr:2-hydroxyacid dehydrogenase [Dictyobacter arantiisoli]GCF09465.1 oxidoreductase [Dictyobacter arantiisoli]